MVSQYKPVLCDGFDKYNVLFALLSAFSCESIIKFTLYIMYVNILMNFPIPFIINKDFKEGKA